MWNPPIVLTSEEQKIAARTRKTRKFFVFLREHRAMSCSTQICASAGHTLVYSPEPGGHEPVEAGLALATLLQAYCHVGDQGAVELTVMDKRWQMVLDCLGAEHPPSVRAPCLASTDATHHPQTWTRPCWIGPSHWRSTPAASVPGNCARSWTPRRCSAPSEVEDTLNLLGHALRKAVGLAAQALDTRRYLWRTQGWQLVGHSSLESGTGPGWGGAQRTLPRAGLGPGGGGTVATRWMEQQHTLAAQTPPLHKVMETITRKQIALRGHRARPGGWTGRATYQAARRT